MKDHSILELPAEEDIILGSTIHGEDGLTNMPVDIIDIILVRMPFRYAVRTSVLSREWRDRWKSIPTLDFGTHFDKVPLVNHTLSSVIYHVLLQHHGLINKFSLHTIGYETQNYFARVMPLLPISKLHDLTLHLSLMTYAAFGLRNSFYSFQNLMHLNLSRCVLDLPLGFRGFQRLITLDFEQVSFAPFALMDLISLSLLLERVSLVWCSWLPPVTVKGPSLRFFQLHGSFHSIHFSNSPLLTQVSLSSKKPLNWRFDQCLGPKYFSICTYAGETASASAYSGGKSIPYPEGLNSLKVLDLSMYLDSVEEVRSALLLARSSPHLQMLQVSLHASRTVQGVIDFIRAQETPDKNLKSIGKVRIAADFSGTEPQIEFVKYLVASTAGLEELVIAPTTSSSSSAGQPASTLEELVMRFPRASPKMKLYVVRK